MSAALYGALCRRRVAREPSQRFRATTRPAESSHSTLECRRVSIYQSLVVDHNPRPDGCNGWPVFAVVDRLGASV